MIAVEIPRGIVLSALMALRTTALEATSVCLALAVSYQFSFSSETNGGTQELITANMQMDLSHMVVMQHIIEPLQILCSRFLMR